MRVSIMSRLTSMAWAHVKSSGGGPPASVEHLRRTSSSVLETKSSVSGTQLVSPEGYAERERLINWAGWSKILQSLNLAV